MNMKALKKQQTHLIQSQDGGIYLTLEYLGKNEFSSNLLFVGKEKAKKILKRGSRQSQLDFNV